MRSRAARSVISRTMLLRERRQRAVVGVQLGVFQIGRVQVDEHVPRRRRVAHDARDVPADDAPQLGRAPQPLGGVEEVQRAAQRRLVGAQQRLVREHAAPRPRHDGLRGDPQLVDRRREPRFETRAVADRLALCSCIWLALAPDARQLVDAHGARHDVQQRFQSDRLEQVAERAVFDRLQRALQRRAAGHEDHRHVEVALADVAQQRQAVHVGHGDVADDHVVALAARQRRSFPAAPATVTL